MKSRIKKIGIIFTVFMLVIGTIGLSQKHMFAASVAPEAVVTLPDAPVAPEIIEDAFNVANVSTEEEFKAAYLDESIHIINLQADMEFGTEFGGVQWVGSSYELNRSLKINGNGHTINFQSYSVAGPFVVPFFLSNTGAGKVFILENVDIDMPYYGYLVGSMGDTATDWSVVFSDMNMIGTNGGVRASGRPIAAYKADLFFRGEGNILEQYGQIFAKNIIIEEGADWNFARSSSSDNQQPIFMMDWGRIYGGGGDVFVNGQATIDGGYFGAIWSFNGIYVGSNGDLSITSSYDGYSLGAITTAGGGGKLWVDNDGRLDIYNPNGIALYAIAGAPLDFRADEGSYITITGNATVLTDAGLPTGVITLATSGSTFSLNSPKMFDLTNLSDDDNKNYLFANLGLFGYELAIYESDIAAWELTKSIDDVPSAPSPWVEANVVADESGQLIGGDAAVAPYWDQTQYRRLVIMNLPVEVEFVSPYDNYEFIGEYRDADGSIHSTDLFVSDADKQIAVKGFLDGNPISTDYWAEVELIANYPDGSSESLGKVRTNDEGIAIFNLDAFLPANTVLTATAMRNQIASQFSDQTTVYDVTPPTFSEIKQTQLDVNATQISGVVEAGATVYAKNITTGEWLKTPTGEMATTVAADDGAFNLTFDNQTGTLNPNDQIQIYATDVLSFQYNGTVNETPANESVYHDATFPSAPIVQVSSIVDEDAQKAIDEINAVADQAKQEIENLENVSDVEKQAAVDAIDNAVSEAVKTIETATPQEMTTIVSDTTAVIDQEVEAAKLLDAKNEAINEINAVADQAKQEIESLENVSDVEKQAAVDAIDNTVSEAVNTIETATPQEMATIVSDTTAVIDQEVEAAKLLDAKNEAINEINVVADQAKQVIEDLENVSDVEKQAAVDAIDNAVSEAVNTIETATPQEIATIVSDTTAVIDQEVEAAKLLDAKNVAINELVAEANTINDAIDTMSELTASEISASKQLIDDELAQGIANIQNMNTIVDVNTTKDDSITNMNDVYNQIKAASDLGLDGSKKQATDQITNAANDAKQEIQALQNLDDVEKAAMMKQIDDEADTAISAIMNSNTILDVVSETTKGMAKLDQILDATVLNDTIVAAKAELVNEATSMKASIDALEGISILEKEASKMMIDGELARALNEVDGMGAIGEVSQAKTVSIATMQAIVDNVLSMNDMNLETSKQDAINQLNEEATASINSIEALSNVSDEVKQTAIQAIEDSLVVATAEVENASSLEVVASTLTTGVDTMKQVVVDVQLQDEKELAKLQLEVKVSEVNLAIEALDSLTVEEKVMHIQSVDEILINGHSAIESSGESSEVTNELIKAMDLVDQLLSTLAIDGSVVAPDFELPTYDTEPQSPVNNVVDTAITSNASDVVSTGDTTNVAALIAMLGISLGVIVRKKAKKEQE